MNLEDIPIKFNRKYLVLLTTVICIVLGAGVIELLLPPNGIDTGEIGEYAIGPPERPGFKASYNLENETLTITIAEGQFTRKSGKVMLISGNRPVEISKTDKTVSNGLWAERTYLGTGLYNQGLRNFPLKENSSLKIVSDTTDIDGDGISGIEEGESVGIYANEEWDLVEIQTFTIVNGSSEKTRSPTPRIIEPQALK